MTTVDDVAKSRPIVLKKNDTIMSAAYAMDGNRIGSVIVADPRGGCIGIMTDRDLIYGLLSGEFHSDTHIDDLMTEGLVFVGPDASIEEAVEKMSAASIRRLAIGQVIAGGKLQITGMLTLDDLITSEAISIQAAAKIIKSQRLGPSRRRVLSRDAVQRREQTYSLFLKAFMTDSGLDRDRAEMVMITVLSTLCRRITPGEATDLCAQLPNKLAEALLTLKRGPDTTLTSEALIDGVNSVTNEGESESLRLVRLCLQFLRRHVSEGEIDDVLAQLPHDWRLLFNESAQEAG